MREQTSDAVDTEVKVRKVRHFNKILSTKSISLDIEDQLVNTTSFQQLCSSTEHGYQ